MVEVALEGYILVHRRDTTNPTPPTDSYKPVLRACTVISAVQAKSRYFEKKDKGGFGPTSTLDMKRQGRFWSMVEVTLNRYISGHRRDRSNLRTLAGSYMQSLPTCIVVSVPRVEFGHLKKRQGWVCLGLKRQGWV